jgi:hypothetical protein
MKEMGKSNPEARATHKGHSLTRTAHQELGPFRRSFLVGAGIMEEGQPFFREGAHDTGRNALLHPFCYPVSSTYLESVGKETWEM